MTRTFPTGAVVVTIAALAILAGAFFAWPQYAAERERAIEPARLWAERGFPSGTLARARVETQATAYGWRVVLRGVDLPCSQTNMGCRMGPGQTDESIVYRDAWVCVEYGTGRGYFFALSVRPVGPVGPNTCKPVATSTPVPDA